MRAEAREIFGRLEGLHPREEYVEEPLAYRLSQDPTTHRNNFATCWLLSNAPLFYLAPIYYLFNKSLERNGFTGMK